MSRNIDNLSEGFDEEVEVDTEFEDGPDYNEDDLRLIELGIELNCNIPFAKEYDKKILYRGQPTKLFFNYYLDRCTPNQYKSIKLDELSDTLKTLYQNKVIEDFPSEQHIIERYMDENAKLIKENRELKRKLNDAAEVVTNALQSIEVIEHNKEIFDMLGWLYNFMGDNMDFNEEYAPEPDDIECIKKIKEEIMKNG